MSDQNQNQAQNQAQNQGIHLKIKNDHIPDSRNNITSDNISSAQNNAAINNIPSNNSPVNVSNSLSINPQKQQINQSQSILVAKPAATSTPTTPLPPSASTPPAPTTSNLSAQNNDLHISTQKPNNVKINYNPPLQTTEMQINQNPNKTTPNQAQQNNPANIPQANNINSSINNANQANQNNISKDQPLSKVDVNNLPLGNGEISIQSLFEYARSVRASDLHICTGSIPKLRIYGEIHPVNGWKELTEEEVLKLIHETMKDGIKKEFTEKQDTDFSFIDNKNYRYRCNAMQTLKGSAAVYRIISRKILTFEELNLPESVRRIVDYKKGLVLITGPAGCGKSTTMATLVDLVNQNDEGHILTVEDPVEILHHTKKSLVNHREVKTNTNSFANALKSALREDPDSIVIGEMRDLETISLALTAAETGHLVFGTLHTSNAAKTITRIIDAYPSGEQGQIRAMLAEGIRCVISQVLCKRKDGQGRVAAFEIMFGTDAIRNLIRTDKIFQIPSSIEVGVREGMQGLDQALNKLWKEDKISFEEAKEHANVPEDFDFMLANENQYAPDDDFAENNV